MIGTKFIKGKFSTEDYAKCAEWCNESQGATIEDKGDYYECVVLEPYSPTAEEQIAQLDAQYEADRSTLKGYYLDFVLDGDTESAEEIKAELDELATAYAEAYETIKAENETEET